MAFSFSNWFKKPGAQEGPHTNIATSEVPPADTAPRTARVSSAPSAPQPTTVAPAPVRTLKTVVPNSVRPVNLREGISRPGNHTAAIAGSTSPRPGPSAVPSTRAIAFPSMVPVAPGGAPPAPVAPTQAAAAPTFNAEPDAPVAVLLGDFFDRIPANLLRPGADVDRTREVVFRAADLYSDLARGRASVPVSAVQTVCPDLFGRPISPMEDVEIILPLQQVIEQLAASLQTRPDQVAEEDVAEIETPFLQVALEDSVRLPKSPAPLRPVAALPPAIAPVRNPLAPKTSAIAGNEAATIRALTPRQTPTAPHAPAQAPIVPSARDGVPPINPVTKRPPSTVRASVAGGKIRLSGPAISSRSIAPAAANSVPAPLAPSAAPALPRPIAPSVGASAAANAPAQRKTARIQIPAIALRPAGASGPASSASAAPRPTAPGAPSRAPLPFPEPLVSFRATPGDNPGSAPAPTASPLPLPNVVASRPAAAPGFTVAPPPMMPFAPLASTPPPPAAPMSPPPVMPVVADDARISLAIAPILRTLPDSMFTGGLDGYGAAEQVHDDAKVELPMGFITAQLAQGRVAVSREMFVAAMPAECRHLMATEGEPSEVLIPLQEVFQNLPTGALSRRHDQVVDEVGPEIPTPFSQKAMEDAQRLAPAAPEPVAAPEPEPVAVLAEPEPPAIIEPEPVATGEPEAITEEAPSPVPDEPTTPILAEPAVTAPPDEEPTPEVLTPEPEPVAEVPVAPPIEEQAVEARTEEIAPVAIEEEIAAHDASEAAEEETSAIAEPEPEPVAVAAVDEPEAPEPVENAPAAVAEPADEVEPVSHGHADSDEPDALESVPVRDFAPAEAVAAPEMPPVSAVPAATVNGQYSHTPMAALTPVPATPREEIQDALRAIFMVDEELDAKKIVRLAAGLPGLKACAVMFGDGLKLAGELEDGLSGSEGFCAMTPPFFRRARAYAAELGLGEAQCVSLQTERALLSFFMAGDVCLSVQHAPNRQFLPGVREKLLAATAEMARMYATPVAP